jgi:hypothetical protein
MPAVKRQRKALRYQYRVLWKYQGSKHVHELRGDRPLTVLKMLRRVATKTPWLGIGRSALRKSWARLCMRLNVPFDVVSGLSPREVAVRIQETFPRLEWCRVEHRQVGDWTETIDPLNTLRTPTTDAGDARTEKLFDDIGAMGTVELDNWRSTISADFLARRKTASNNRELRKPEVE